MFYFFQDDISLGRKESLAIIKNTKYFITAFEYTTETFSYFLFWIMVSTITALIFTTYRLITFMLGSYLMTWEYCFMTISFLIYFMTLLWLIWFLCHTSEKLSNKVQMLKVILLDLNFSETETSLVIGQNGFQETEFMIEKQAVYLRLDSFKGFHALNFFVVRNSLLTGLASNFVTYVILLVQFKITQMSLK